MRTMPTYPLFPTCMWIAPAPISFGQVSHVPDTPIHVPGDICHPAHGSPASNVPPIPSHARTTPARMISVPSAPCSFSARNESPAAPGSNITEQPDKNSHPRRFASSTIAASKSAREIATSRGIASSSDRRPTCQTTESIGSARRSAASIPIFRSTSTAAAFRHPPQTFSRGHVDFSTSKTRQPRSASIVAATPPPTPAPTTTASQYVPEIVTPLRLPELPTSRESAKASAARSEPHSFQRPRQIPPVPPPSMPPARSREHRDARSRCG
jgi:hypothetical protein